MKRQRSDAPPAAVERATRLWVWIDGHLPHLPAFARASAGAKLVDAALALLEDLSLAAWSPRGSSEGAAALRRANQRVAFARLLLRGMRERRYLSTEQHAYAVGELDAIGRMVGAWLRSLPAGAS